MSKKTLDKDGNIYLDHEAWVDNRRTGLGKYQSDLFTYEGEFKNSRFMVKGRKCTKMVELKKEFGKTKNIKEISLYRSIPLTLDKK